jgi:transposase, IS30 family
VCHETIYQSLYSPVFVGLGLRGQDCLRSRRRRRRRRGGRDNSQKRRRHFGEFKLIDQRPPAAADRSEAGHWEGDLIIGAHKRTAIATLVERSSRLTLMADLPNGYRPSALRRALAAVLGNQPPTLLRTLTWDQGIEMCAWADIEADLGISVYCCHPHSPW